MVSNRPELVQFSDLRADHFERHAVWVNCHGIRDIEAWYDAVDEETFCPWFGGLPVEPSEGLLLVAAMFTFADGENREGFVTPLSRAHPDNLAMLGQMQPFVFLSTGRPHGFWHGMFPRHARREEFFAALGRRERVFPIAFEMKAGLATGVGSGVIAGFYTRPGGLRGPAIIDR